MGYRVSLGVLVSLLFLSGWHLGLRFFHDFVFSFLSLLLDLSTSTLGSYVIGLMMMIMDDESRHTFEMNCLGSLRSQESQIAYATYTLSTEYMGLAPEFA